MASDGTDDVLQQLMTLQQFTLIQYALISLTLFDFALTLTDEWKFIWKAKKNLVFFLFVCIRYTNLGAITANALSNILPLEGITGCKIVIYVNNALSTITSASILALFAFRSFAIWERHRVVLAVLLGIAIAKLSVDTAINFFFTDIHVLSGLDRKYMACKQGMSNQLIGEKLACATAALLFLFDTVVFGLILVKTIRLIFGQSHGHMKSGYLHIIFRDGLLFYLTIEILVIASAVFDQIGSLGVLGQITQMIEPALSPILAQRLVLSLKHVHGNHSTPSKDSEFCSKTDVF